MFLAKLKRFEPIDRVAVSLMLLLSFAIGFLLIGGDRSLPKVRDFSWQNKQVGARDTAFILTFSRPMDHQSVEGNLHIEPPLRGKISWSGRRLVYTLTAPPQYDRTYKIELQTAREKLGFDKPGNAIAPFASQFNTPDRAFVYTGTEAAEKGRLILYNLTRKQKIILTPENLVVKNFRIYPAGDRILFSASEWSKYKPGLYEQSLYAVTTGRSSDPAQKPGTIQQILGNQDYENLKFDLSSRRQGDRHSASQEGQCRGHRFVGAAAGNFPDSTAAVESAGGRICDRPGQCNFSQSPSRRYRYFIPDTKRQTFRLHTIFSEGF